MTTGVEQDIRELQKAILEIAKDGCGHRLTEEKLVEKAQDQITEERRAREKFQNEISEEMKSLKDCLTLRIAVALLGTVILNFAGAYYLLFQIAASSVKIP